MRMKRSAKKARQKRDRNRRLAARSARGNRVLRCEPLESRVLLDAGGLFPGTGLSGTGLPGDGLPDPTNPVSPFVSSDISGIVWQDTDGNRQRDGIGLGGNEPGMGGVTVYSDFNFNGFLDADEPSAVTSYDDPTTDFDEGGRYTLADLQPGYHNVRQIAPSGYEQTYPSLPEGYLPPPWGDASVHVTFVEQGQWVDGIDFGNQELELASIHGTKWEDLNGDGFRGLDEPGLAGVTIYSDTNHNGLLDFEEPHTVTMADNPVTDFDESGLYWLDVDSGFHVVREVVPEGFQQTFPVNYFPLDPAALPFDDFSILPPLDGAHFVSIEAGQSVGEIDFGNQKVEQGSISGVKWGDANGNAEFDPWESGLAGVTVYADMNDNGWLDPNEPSTITTADIPETDFDEAGRYTLAGLAAGDYVIREVVPDGFQQTYPLIDLPKPLDVGSDIVDAEFATIEPGRLDFLLASGNVFVADVAITIHPTFIRAMEIDVTASSADITLINLSGPQINGGGGATSVFQILVISNGAEFDGELQFVDLFDGNTFASIPLTISMGLSEDGSHRVTLGSGETLDGLNFGNQELVVDTGTVSGRKWQDSNGNAEHDPDEAGLAGVTVYADLNLNGQWDPNEPSAVTSADIPETDFDEGGLYSFETSTGFQAIREIVPHGYRQTYPVSDATSPLEVGAHFVDVVAGGYLDGLDFGNQPIDVGISTVSGTKWEDSNGNGQRDANEVGLGGVTIYSDLNSNYTFDPDEPHAVTGYDDPATDFDEGGLYTIDDLSTGGHVIREVVPDGYWQTFPISIALSPIDFSPFEQGAHYVLLTSGSHATDIDFGNQFIAEPLPGDFSNNGYVGGEDLEIWQAEYGNEDSLGTPGSPGGMDGSSFLDWQRNLGMATPLPLVTASVSEASASETPLVEPVESLPAVDLSGSPLGSSRGQYRPAGRRLDAVEAAFAESSQPNWRLSQLDAPTAEQTAAAVPQRSSRGAVAQRAAYGELAAAFDAAFESDFGA